MSILKVDKIVSRSEDSNVAVEGLRVGPYPEEMDIETEDFVSDGSVVYQDNKFKFKEYQDRSKNKILLNGS